MLPPQKLLTALAVLGAVGAAYAIVSSRKKNRNNEDESYQVGAEKKTGSISKPPVSSASATPKKQFDYPATRRDSTVVEELHGQMVSDPYRWLEDPDSDETKKWVKSQTDFTDKYLQDLPSREKFRARMTELYSYDQYSTPSRKGDWIFFSKKAGLQNQWVLYKQYKSLDADAEVLLDPNAMAADGSLSLGCARASRDGTKLAYALARNGSDWMEIYVRDVATGKDAGDHLRWVKFSGIEWAPDGSGIFYSRYPPRDLGAEEAGTETQAMENQKLYYHKLGTKQEDDVLVMERPDQPKWMFGSEVTDDGETLVISISESCDPKNLLFTLDLASFFAAIQAKGEGEAEGSVPKPQPVVDSFEASYDYVTNEGSKFLFLTNHSAPRYRIVSMDIDTKPAATAAAAAAPLKLEEVVPEDPERAVLESAVSVAGDKLLLRYLRDVKNELEVCNVDGSGRRTLPLPVIGSLGALVARKETPEFFFSLTSFLTPGTTYRCVLGDTPATTAAAAAEPTAGSDSGSDWFTLTPVRTMDLPGFDASLFEVRQEWYSSSDGTRVPMFLVSRKQTKEQQQQQQQQQQQGKPVPAPCFLYAYGGFNISITPGFYLSSLIAVAHYGAVCAFANLRGGGEYGKEWHEAGTKLRKQNVFDDFKSAARHLVATGVTTHEQIAIRGGSNGGLLVAACVTQSPELFRAAVAQVPVADMLRFHKFTIGAAWCSDYGCADDEEEFKALVKYSPVHNVRASAGRYPSLLVCTGSHDDRVSPLHSFKFISEVQAKVGPGADQPNPQLIRIETKAGHGAGKPTSMVIQEAADVFAFAAHAVGATWQD